MAAFAHGGMRIRTKASWEERGESGVEGTFVRGSFEVVLVWY